MPLFSKEGGERIQPWMGKTILVVQGAEKFAPTWRGKIQGHLKAASAGCHNPSFQEMSIAASSLPDLRVFPKEIEIEKISRSCQPIPFACVIQVKRAFVPRKFAGRSFSQIRR
jgi:hypothetical protein